MLQCCRRRRQPTKHADSHSVGLLDRFEGMVPVKRREQASVRRVCILPDTRSRLTIKAYKNLPEVVWSMPILGLSSGIIYHITSFDYQAMRRGMQLMKTSVWTGYGTCR